MLPSYPMRRGGLQSCQAMELESNLHGLRPAHLLSLRFSHVASCLVFKLALSALRKCCQIQSVSSSPGPVSSHHATCPMSLAEQLQGRRGLASGALSLEGGHPHAPWRSAHSGVPLQQPPGPDSTLISCDLFNLHLGCQAPPPNWIHCRGWLRCPVFFTGAGSGSPCGAPSA